MNLKNYTSVVPAPDSAAAIEQLLVEAGATSISKWYEDKQLAGFLFQIPVNGVPVVFQLPAKAEAVTKFMLNNAPRADAKKRAGIRTQAQRTAWRTLHEWVQIQVAMIQLQQVEALQVFLPYAYNQSTGTTHYDQVKAGDLKLLN